jgi:hypothetical protein
MNYLLRRYDIHESRDVAFPNDGLFTDVRPTSTIALCQEIYADFGMARVTSYSFGTRIFKYTEDSGIRPGDDVVVQVFSGVPLITHKVHYGYDPQKSILIDFDNEDGKIIQRVKKEPEWREEEAEWATARYCIVKHKPGERSFTVDMAGLFVGYSAVRLFYAPDSRIEVYRKNINLISPNIYMMTKNAAIELDDEEEGGGVYSYTFFEDEDSVVYTTREFKGNVSKQLTAKGIFIESGYGLFSVLSLEDVVYLFMVIDRERKEYEQEVSIVSHRYSNRKLSIDGNKSHSDISINDMTLKVSRLTEEDLKVGAIVIGFEDDSFPVTYLRAIDIKGNVFEFAAGKKHTIAKDRSDIVFHDRLSVSMGEEWYVRQSNRNDIHYPINEGSYDIRETYGTSITSIKGRSVASYYEEEFVNRINFTEEYEVDAESGIDTLKKSTIPKEIVDRHNYIINFDDLKISSPVEEQVIFNYGKNVVSHIRNATNTLFGISGSVDGKSASMILNGDTFSVGNEGAVRLESEILLASNNYSIFDGIAVFNNGVRVDGDFFIKADNIYMEATKNYYIRTLNAFIMADKSIGFTYKDKFYASCTDTIYEGKEKLSPAAFNMDKTKVTVSAEDFFVYADNNGSIYAKERLGMGSENTSISGLSYYGSRE